MEAVKQQYPALFIDGKRGEHIHVNGTCELGSRVIVLPNHCYVFDDPLPYQVVKLVQNELLSWMVFRNGLPLMHVVCTM